MGNYKLQGAWPTVCEQPPCLPSAPGRDRHLLPIQSASGAGFAPGAALQPTRLDLPARDLLWWQ